MVRPSIHLLILIGAVLMLGAHSARAEQVRLLMSGNLERIFPVLSPDEKLRNADLEFEKVLTKLKAESPDALLVDAGRAQSITHTNETGYSIPVWNVFEYTGYHLTNMDARESITGTDGIYGLEMAPESFRKRTITAAVGNRFEPLDLPVSRTIATEKGRKVSFTSLANLDAAKGLGSRTQLTKRRTPEEMFKAIAEARAAGLPTVAFASAPRLIPTFPDADSTPEVIVSFETDGAPRKIEAEPAPYWLVSAPPAGKLYKLDLDVDGPKVTKAPKVDTVAYIDKAALDHLIEYPLPKIGVLIPNLEHTISQFFDATQGSASLDRFPLDKVADLTAVPPHVYTVPTEDGNQRVYRVQSLMPYYKLGNPQDPSWPQMDMLVVLDQEHRFQRVISRVEFPLATTNTVVLEDLNRRPGTDPRTWEFDPAAADGVEELWNWAVAAIRQSVELDRRLHPTP